MMFEKGQLAPDFSLEDKEGNVRRLSEFRGKKVVLYFYSKDMTGGCTKQACGFAELYPEFQALGAEVIGVSKDTPETHTKFAAKYNLPFVLLSDPELGVLTLYDVYKEKNMCGKKVMGTVRTTILIDEEGKVIQEYRKVKAEQNPADMLEALKAIK